jgi:hypothetical protein
MPVAATATNVPLPYITAVQLLFAALDCIVHASPGVAVVGTPVVIWVVLGRALGDELGVVDGTRLGSRAGDRLGVVDGGETGP